MNTTIIEIKGPHERDKILQAARFIIEGQTVVFPTETVYGIGADAFNAGAVKKIFETKNRPQDNPLIVHIATFEQFMEISSMADEQLLEVLRKFWPGPLTVIVPHKGNIPAIVTAGLPTVGIRMPGHKVTREIIKESGRPVAAPSANFSGEPSSTRFEHVLQDFQGKVPCIVKSFEPEIGMESTVLDVTSQPWRILRPGYISAKEISDFSGLPVVYAKKSDGDKPLSPGMKYRHYAPKKPLFVFSSDSPEELLKALFQTKKPKRFWIVSKDFPIETYFSPQDTVINYHDGEDLIKNLYYWLKESDRLNPDYILLEYPEGLSPEKDILLRNRLEKAANEFL